MELNLTSLRVKALESNFTLLNIRSLSAVFSDINSITFYEPGPDNHGFFLEEALISNTINESSLHRSFK